MGWYAKQRALDRIRVAAAEGLDLVSFWEEAAAAIRPAVAHHLAPCWFTLDPASLLATSHYDHGMIAELPAGWLATEYCDEDPHKLSGAARSASGLSTVHEVCGGDPTRSRRWMQYVQPYGGDQELFVALRAETRHTWGVLALYREPGRRVFDRDERELLRLAAPHLADGARRSLLVGAASEPDLANGPGLLVLGTDWQVESLTPGLERWLDDLPGGAWSERGKLPPSHRVDRRSVRPAGAQRRAVDADLQPGAALDVPVLSALQPCPRGRRPARGDGAPRDAARRGHVPPRRRRLPTVVRA